MNLSGQDTGLRTEVEILKSPSVLKPIFEFVRQEKIKKGGDFQNWRYSEWLYNSLDIDLETGTSVLSLSYEDSHKNLIIPVLQKVSKAYQEYSLEKRLNSLNKSLSYLDEQISIYEKKAFVSLNKLQNFALENEIDNSILDAVTKDQNYIISNSNQFIYKTK